MGGGIRIRYGSARTSRTSLTRISAPGIPFSQVAAAAHNEELLPPDVEPGLEFNATYTLPDNPYAFGTHVAVVEVDRDNGAVKILKYIAVHDAGRILNPMLAEGQIHGGLAQGLGQALFNPAVLTPPRRIRTNTRSILKYGRFSTISHLTNIS